MSDKWGKYDTACDAGGCSESMAVFELNVMSAISMLHYCGHEHACKCGAPDDCHACLKEKMRERLVEVLSMHREYERRADLGGNGDE